MAKWIGTYLLGLFILSGCATQKELQATGGSRADGTVKLSYEVGLFEKAVVDWDQGKETASQRCRAWGYGNAEPFGGVTTFCQQRNGYGNCLDAIVTAEYQCTGSMQSEYAPRTQTQYQPPPQPSQDPQGQHIYQPGEYIPPMR